MAWSRYWVAWSVRAKTDPEVQLGREAKAWALRYGIGPVPRRGKMPKWLVHRYMHSATYRRLHGAPPAEGKAA